MDFRLKGPNGQATLRGVAADRPLDAFLQDGEEMDELSVVTVTSVTSVTVEDAKNGGFRKNGGISPRRCHQAGEDDPNRFCRACKDYIH